MNVIQDNTDQRGVEWWIDHCDTATMGDIGKNIAQHSESTKLGYENLNEFEQRCENFDEENLNPSDALAYIVADQTEENLDEIYRIARESQIMNKELYGDGFLHLHNHRGNQGINIITAGLEDAAEHTLEHLLEENTPEVYGAQLEQTDSGVQVGRYCSQNKKLDVLKKEKDYNPQETISIAFGNSPNDAPLMQNSQEAFGRERAQEFSTIYFEDDPNFWSRGFASIITEELLKNSTPQKALQEAQKYLQTGHQEYNTIQLEEPELISQGPVTQQVYNLYENQRNLTQDPTRKAAASDD